MSTDFLERDSVICSELKKVTYRTFVNFKSVVIVNNGKKLGSIEKYQEPNRVVGNEERVRLNVASSYDAISAGFYIRNLHDSEGSFALPRPQFYLDSKGNKKKRWVGDTNTDYMLHLAEKVVHGHPSLDLRLYNLCLQYIKSCDESGR